MSAAETTPPRDRLTTLRLALAEKGYRPVPVSGPKMNVPSAGKRPLMKNWRELCAHADAAEIARWTRAEQNCTNTGLLCGELVGVDVDVLVHDLAEKIAATARATLGTTPLVRIGKAPKLLLCFRAAAPFAKMETPELFLPDGSKAQVEVLAAGQQFVAHGIHPDTGQPYEWPQRAPETIPLADLPPVSESDLRAFLAAAEGILRASGGQTQAERDGKPPKPQDTPKGPAPGAKVIDFKKATGKGNFFVEVNRLALAAIEPWFPAIFPGAQLQTGTGAWRVSSDELGRGLEEDLSMHPTQGGMDWGTRKSCSPIDVVMQHGGAPDAAAAALWLCERIGADPASLGWKEKPKKEKAKKKADADLSDMAAFAVTEDGIALAFASKYRDELRFCHHAGKWYVWTGTRWMKEETKLAFSWAREICRELNASGEDKIAKASTAAAVERFAQTDRAFAVTSSVWDADKFLLGTPSGVVDLRTGTLRPPQRTDYITRQTAVGPAEKGTQHPVWSRFLDEATQGDKGLQRFLQQVAGYCLTGDVREHALFFVYGPGGNGKTVFLNALSGILGDYATTAAMDTFTASQTDRHPTDLAMLQGARLVSASETEEGRAWAESRIKQMTGGDMIRARFMRQDFFEYRPQFKLIIIGNHKPVLRNVDDAARRRFNIIPFVHTPAQPDKELEDKLKAEWSAILAWAIEGAMDWQGNGLVRPRVVSEATNEYFSEQDLIRQWVDECCDQGGRNVSDTTASLFASWSAYATANGERPGTTKWFTQVLQRMGFETVRDTPGHRNKRGFLRIAVKPVDTSNQWQNRLERDDGVPF